MQYSVELTMETPERLTGEVLAVISGLGGAVWVHDGERRFELLLTVQARDLVSAAAEAAATLRQSVSGTLVALSSMTTAEAARRDSAGRR